jgi:hypothetical protein
LNAKYDNFGNLTILLLLSHFWSKKCASSIMHEYSKQGGAQSDENNGNNKIYNVEDVVGCVLTNDEEPQSQVSNIKQEHDASA